MEPTAPGIDAGLSVTLGTESTVLHRIACSRLRVLQEGLRISGRPNDAFCAGAQGVIEAILCLVFEVAEARCRLGERIERVRSGLADLTSAVAGGADSMHHDVGGVLGEVRAAVQVLSRIDDRQVGLWETPGARVENT